MKSPLMKGNRNRTFLLNISVHGLDEVQMGNLVVRLGFIFSLWLDQKGGVGAKPPPMKWDWGESPPI